MADEQPDKETEITPKGAVEVSEEDLDQASGAGIDHLKVSAYDLSPEKKVGYDLTGQKVVPAEPLTTFVKIR